MNSAFLRYAIIFILAAGGGSAVFAGCGDDSGEGGNNDVDATATECGNGSPDPGEECDDGVNNSDTAPDACRTDCRSAHCGDGVKDTTEQCDEDDLGMTVCDDLGYNRGVLSCNTDCTFDESECYTCGDNVIDTPEDCDGTNLGGESCASLTGLPEGALACDQDCHWDTSACYF